MIPENNVLDIDIHLKAQALPIQREGVRNAYVKEGLYCVHLGETIEKYPLCNIYNIVEYERDRCLNE